MLRLFAFGSALRRWARWLLLPALVLWPLDLVLFGTELGQFAVFAAAFFPGLFAVALGLLGLCIEWIASGHPDAPAVPLRPLVRDVALAALATVAWVAAGAADAHLWL